MADAAAVERTLRILRSQAQSRGLEATNPAAAMRLYDLMADWQDRDPEFEAHQIYVDRLRELWPDVIVGRTWLVDSVSPIAPAVAVQVARATGR